MLVIVYLIKSCIKITAYYFYKGVPIASPPSAQTKIHPQGQSLLGESTQIRKREWEEENVNSGHY